MDVGYRSCASRWDHALDHPAQPQIGPFASGDLSVVERLILTTIDASYGSVYPNRAVDYFKRLHSKREILARVDGGVVLVVESGGEIVGTGSLVGGEIGGVLVRSDLQGAGIGTLIMDELEAQASAEGLQSVSLCVSLPSRGFYERRGYSMSELLSGDMGEGQALDYWRARKSVPND